MAHSRIPVPEQAQVYIDFDGTISQQDILDALIERFAVNESWKLIEQRWQAGLIGSRECLTQEFALLAISKPQLETFLDGIRLDPGIHELLDLLAAKAVPVAILSDGIDRFIQRTLKRHAVHNITIRANTITHRGEKLHLRCPHQDAACTAAAAHCKCASARSLQQAGRVGIYIGDGRSDLCPAQKCPVVFAKSALAKSLAQQHVPFYPYTGLRDVAAALDTAWSQRAAVV